MRTGRNKVARTSDENGSCNLNKTQQCMQHGALFGELFTNVIVYDPHNSVIA